MLKKGYKPIGPVNALYMIMRLLGHGPAASVDFFRNYEKRVILFIIYYVRGLFYIFTI